MIVISGALVLVAAVLLVLGIVSSITLVYAAIGLSLVSAVFLLVGVFQRPVLVSERESSDEDARTRAAPAVQMSKPKQPERVAVEPEPEAEYVDELAAVDTAADYPLEAANADFEQRAEATGADVLVISGRPRYHGGGCEYVEGHEESEPLDIVEARELGFTPCGVCRPNETLALGAAGPEGAAPPAAPEPVPAASAPPTLAVPVAGAVHDPGSNGGSLVAANGVHPVAPVTVEQPAVVAAAPVSEPFVAAAPPVTAAALTPPPVAVPVAVPLAEPPVAAAIAAESESAAPATAASARPRVGAPTVQAVTVTKEYHRSGCVLLEGVNADELTKAAAIRQGFLACGVCKP